VTSTLIIPARFNGPPTSGNGGVSAGRVAALVSATEPVEVSLRSPVPLDELMRASTSDGVTSVYAGELLVAEARVVDSSALGQAVAPVDFPDAVVAAIDFAGLAGHPYPTCFVCGTGRPTRDGLEVYPGPVAGDPGYVAGALVLRPEHVDDSQEAAHARLGEMHPRIGADLLWAALDCPGGWAAGLGERPALLGRLTARIRELPAIGEHCVVVGVLDGRDGRKAFTRTTAYGADGRELGRAAAVWIELKR
jgi:hypothetical protein